MKCFLINRLTKANTTTDAAAAASKDASTPRVQEGAGRPCQAEEAGTAPKQTTEATRLDRHDEGGGAGQETEACSL